MQISDKLQNQTYVDLKINTYNLASHKKKRLAQTSPLIITDHTPPFNG